MAHKRLTLTAYETLQIRNIARAMVASQAYRRPQGPLAGLVLMRAAALACTWERQGVVAHAGEV